MKQAITQYAMMVLLIVGAYFLGVYKTQVEYLQKEKAQPNTVAQVQGQQAQASPAPTTVDMAKVKALFADKSNLVFGDPNSKLLFVEFSDPSCPYCHVAGGLDAPLNKQAGFTLASDGGTYQPAVPEMRKLVEAGKAAFAWVYVPGHGNGEMGTMALYCANEQGKFWAVHDLLMSDTGYNELNNVVRNDRSKSGDMATFLKTAIDPTFMKSCLDSGKYAPRLASDTQLGSSFGASATPTFLVNDQVIEGAMAWDQGFKSIVDPLL